MRLLYRGALWTVRQLLFSLLELIERQRRANESHMGKCLGKISQSASGSGINFFAIKPQVVAILGKQVHQIACFLGCSATNSEIFSFPEATNGESPFLRLRPVP